MTPWVLRLIIANVGVYFLQQTLPGIDQLLELRAIGLVYRPWTLVTYMFLTPI